MVVDSRGERPLALVIALAACSFDSSGVGTGGETADSPDTSATSLSTTGPTTSATASTTATTTSQGSEPTTMSATSSATTTESADATADDTTSDSDSVPGWWDPAWSSRRRITFTLPDGVPGPLDDVPVLIKLDDTRIDYAELELRGRDLRFVDADDDTMLSHEIEHWDPDEQSSVWVKIPELLADGDFIYMYWDNPEALMATDPHGVWSPGYAGVWHLDDDPSAKAPQILDSSPSDRHAIALGDMALDDLTQGFATPALEFDGIDDAALVGTIDTDAWTEITVSAWVFHGNEDDERAVSKAFGVGGSDHVFMLGAHGPDVKLRLRTEGDGGDTIEVRPAGSLPGMTWAYLAMVWSATSDTIALFIDGVEVEAASLGGDSLADGSYDVLIANAVVGQDRFWTGVLDEVRIEHDARSPDWILTQFASMRDQLATFEPEEQVP